MSKAATNPLTLLLNADLFSPESIGKKNLLVAGGKIVAIFDQNITLPELLAVEEIDLKGRRVIPGFIDCHAHITGGGGEAGFSSQIPTVPIKDFALAGVTSVVGLLGTDDTTRSIANLLSRVYGLRELGLSAYCWTGGYHYPLTTLTGSGKTDITYLDPVIGIGEFAISDHRSSQPTFDEVVRLASEAHVAGLLTGKAGIIHFHLGDGDRKVDLIKRALAETELPPRVFHPTHVNRNKPLFDDCCELLKLGCNIDITAFPRGTADPGLEADDAILLAIERGLPLSQITVSSDGGGCLPCFNSQGEMTHMGVGSADTLLATLKSLLVKNQPLSVVLPLFTANVAKLLKFPFKGQLKIGYDADLIVLDEENNISDVMGGGRWLVQRGESKV